MTAASVAAAIGGDDAQLRAAGEAISGGLGGNGASFESFRPLAPASCPCNERIEGAPASDGSAPVEPSQQR